MRVESSEKNKDKYVGIIYPVPSNLVSRFFDQGKNVFVKYLPKVGYHHLKVGNKILFYASRQIKKIVGEGTIQRLELLKPVEALEKYRENLFLSEEELEEYRHRRSNRPPTKKLLVLVIQNLRKYSRPVEPEKFITMTGRRITKKEYNALRARSNSK